MTLNKIYFHGIINLLCNIYSLFSAIYNAQNASIFEQAREQRKREVALRREQRAKRVRHKGGVQPSTPFPSTSRCVPTL